MDVLDFEDLFDEELGASASGSFDFSIGGKATASSSGSSSGSSSISSNNSLKAFAIKKFPVYWEYSTKAGKILKYPYKPTGRELANFMVKYVKELPGLIKVFKYPTSGVSVDWIKQQAINRATGHKMPLIELAMYNRLFPSKAIKPKITSAPIPPKPVDNVVTKAIKALTSLKPTPKPVPVIDMTPKPAITLMPAPRTSHVDTSPNKVGVVKDCTCPQPSVVATPKAETADGFWKSELGQAILNNPVELAKFKANPDAYIAAIKQIGPEVEHIKDIATFLGCNASNEDIKRYLQRLELQSRVTGEHNALVKQSAFRKATINKLDNILHKLPSTISANQAVLLIRNACGIG